MVTRLRLACACGDYDRTRALADGTITPDGVELIYLALTVEETFFRMIRHHEFEVAELSLSSYIASLEADPAPFVAVPVFPSRAFRHSGIYVNTASGISSPGDLVGRTVGMPEYQLSACVWIRGILADDHGVPLESVTYRTGGQETPGRIEKAPLRLPDGQRVEPIASGETLSRMLVDGEIDALYSPRAPRPFIDADPRVARLFADVEKVEKQYFARTGIFPIMHVLVVRRDIYEAHPWVVQSLTKAFAQAKSLAEERFVDTSALAVMLPWLGLHAQDAASTLGDDYWSYGLRANHHVLETFLRYHHDQGLSAARFAPEDLFAPESLESFVV